MRNSGFTVVELAVVVTAISLFVVLIVITLQSPRLQANDVNIKTYLYQIMSLAMESYNQYGNYYHICAPDNTLIDSGRIGILEKALWHDNDRESVTCYASKENFAVSSPLRLGNNWCVGSAGLSIERYCRIDVADCLTPCQ